jgi:hypothetical protein
MDQTTRQIIALHVGDRRRDSAKQWWANLPAGYREQAGLLSRSVRGLQRWDSRFPPSGTKPSQRKRAKPTTVSGSRRRGARVSSDWYGRPSRSRRTARITAVPCGTSSVLTTARERQHVLSNTPSAPCHGPVCPSPTPWPWLAYDDLASIAACAPPGPRRESRRAATSVGKTGLGFSTSRISEENIILFP